MTLAALIRVVLDVSVNENAFVGIDVVVVVGCCSKVVVAPGEGVGAAVDVGAQLGQRKLLTQQPLGQLLKQLVSVEPEYTPCPRHDCAGVYESGKSTFRSWLLWMLNSIKLLSLLKSGREESLFRCKNSVANDDNWPS